MSKVPFWEQKSLDAMSDEEWESLCDGCGQCCLHKLVNDESGDVFYTRVACALLHPETGRCTRYADRLRKVEDCMDVRHMRSAELAWMPRSCAYRRLAEGKPLMTWFFPWPEKHLSQNRQESSPMTVQILVAELMGVESFGFHVQNSDLWFSRGVNRARGNPPVPIQGTNLPRPEVRIRLIIGWINFLKKTNLEVFV